MLVENTAASLSELLLSAVRPLSDERVIRRWAEKRADCDSLTELAWEHGVLPLLYSRLAEFEALVPPDCLARLRDESCTNTAQNLAAASELLTLLEEFRRKEIPVLPFKGVALAAAVYNDTGLRPAGDLDLLIFQSDLPKASQILVSRAYELTTPVGPGGVPLDLEKHEYHFERTSDGMIVELRWRLTQPLFRRDWGMDWLWPRRQTATLFGTQIPALSAEQTLIVLCLHGSKHGWSRLIWIRDVAQLLSVRSDLDWDRTFQGAKRFGLSRPLALGILLAVDTLGAQVPERILRRVRKDRVAGHLAQHIAANLFDDANRIPQGRVPYHIQLLERSDRIRWRWHSGPWRPNQKDREIIQLPPPLYFLYYLIRPLRLLRDYLTKGHSPAK